MSEANTPIILSEITDPMFEVNTGTKETPILHHFDPFEVIEKVNTALTAAGGPSDANLYTVLTEQFKSLAAEGATLKRHTLLYLWERLNAFIKELPITKKLSALQSN